MDVGILVFSDFSIMYWISRKLHLISIESISDKLKNICVKRTKTKNLLLKSESVFDIEQNDNIRYQIRIQERNKLS